MTVQGILPFFVVCNTGIHDIESQNPIPYYLAPFVIISRCSKETVQCCKVISPTNLPAMFTLILHITAQTGKQWRLSHHFVPSNFVAQSCLSTDISEGGVMQEVR